jgi:hypothetical protein
MCNTAHARACLLTPRSQPRELAEAEPPLPPVVRMRFPPGSLRVARGVSEDDDESGPPTARTQRSSAVSAAPASPARPRPDSARSSSGASEPEETPRSGRRRRGRRRGERGERDDDGRTFGRQRSSARRRDAAPPPPATPRTGDGDAGATRALAADMRHRALMRSGSVRASLRSPHAEARLLHAASAHPMCRVRLLTLCVT